MEINKSSIKSSIQYYVLVVLLYITTFEEPLEFSALPFLYGIFNICAVNAVAFVIVRSLYRLYKRKLRLQNVIALAGAALYLVSGYVGYLNNHFQSSNNTIISMFDNMRFWLLLVFFYCIFKDFDFKRYASRISTHMFIISGFFTVMVIIDLVFKIWPRQIFRFGIGSVQLFYAHPTVLAAHTAFVLCMLCALVRYNRHAIIFIPGRLITLFLTIRLRVIGLVAVTVLMIIFFVLLDQKLTLKNGIVMLITAVTIGGKRFVRAYTSPDALKVARGQFAHNSIKIAKEYFPFGSGMGTFGSRIAQRFYSPLYYKYGMTTTLGMDPIWPAFACDTFWPMILGETGVIGLIGYVCMIAVLFIKVQSLRKCSVWLYIGAMTALAYEMLETTGALAFSDVTAVSLALVLGLIFAIRKDPEPGKELLQGILKDSILGFVQKKPTGDHD